MFFPNAVKLWNVSDNDLVRSSDVKKFKRNHFDSVVMCKFTPGGFKIDIIFELFK